MLRTAGSKGLGKQRACRIVRTEDLAPALRRVLDRAVDLPADALLFIQYRDGQAQAAGFDRRTKAGGAGADDHQVKRLHDVFHGQSSAR